MVSPNSFEPTALTIVVGKGGVGRTTVALGLARAAASRGDRVAYVAFQDANEPGAMESSSVTTIIVRRAEALQDAAASVIGSSRVARALLGNFAMQQLLAVVPAIHEYAFLVASLEVTKRVDRVFVDMPATGHGAAWLAVAGQLAALVPTGRARLQAEHLDASLRDRHATSFVVVTLPESLVITETRELRASLRANLGRDADVLVINRVPLGVSERCAAAMSQLDARSTTDDDNSAWRQLAAWLREKERSRSLADSVAGELPSVMLTAQRGTLSLDAIAAKLSRMAAR